MKIEVGSEVKVKDIIQAITESRREGKKFIVSIEDVIVSREPVGKKLVLEEVK